MKDFHPKLVDALNKIQQESNFEKFVYKDYICIVKRMMGAYSFFGNLNGYVVLLPDDKYNGKHYDEIDVNCHGGLTWSSNAEDLFPEYKDDDYWIIGFDCAHYGDLQPFMILTEMWMTPPFDNTIILDDPNLTYKDFEYVRNECRKIVDQLDETKD